MREEQKKSLSASINVAQLLKEPMGSSLSREISGVISEEVEGFVQGEAKLTRIKRGVLVHCQLTAEVKLVCSRCLDEFTCPVSFIADEEFLSASDVPGWQVASAEESGEFLIDSKNIVDLSELIRQYILLNLPMKPLCRPDCSGIG